MQQSGMYPMNTAQSSTELDVDLMDHVIAQRQTFSQPHIIGQDPMSFYNPNMVVNASNNPHMMSNVNTHPGLSQYPPRMMNWPQVQQQMMRASTIANRMMAPSNIQAPQLGSINTTRYPTPFQANANNDMSIYNHLPNPGSGTIGQNFVTGQTVRSHINRPSLSPYGTPYSPYAISPSPGPYQHMTPMMRNPFYPSESYFSRYQAVHSNSPSNQNISTMYSVASSVVDSDTLSHQQQVLVLYWYFI